LVYEFTEELKRAYQDFNLDIPARNGTPGEWALPVSATYVIDRDASSFMPIPIPIIAIAPTHVMF
jgi:hypothetical protein